MSKKNNTKKSTSKVNEEVQDENVIQETVEEVAETAVEEIAEEPEVEAEDDIMDPVENNDGQEEEDNGVEEPLNEEPEVEQLSDPDFVVKEASVEDGDIKMTVETPEGEEELDIPVENLVETPEEKEEEEAVKASVAAAELGMNGDPAVMAPTVEHEIVETDKVFDPAGASTPNGAQKIAGANERAESPIYGDEVMEFKPAKPKQGGVRRFIGKLFGGSWNGMSIDD